MHPVLESLKNTDKQWLIETLFAFNSGNPDLAAQEAKLMKKIQLLCVMEMTFTRPANHRQLTFQEISQSTKVPVNEIKGMKERLDFWCGDVKSMAVLVEHQAQDILT
ncbi:26S proteasome non-ATPase regulatory subunit 13 [Silurus asotus]|uniref:26S proteasome non-ATPase regulatory subunit 13 n=1 Tax=Silurus asotus TaxID=30991 RepID=A0AAD5FGH9_SILAS|nr:26S proteasome non-ATPase regulatory subunit 13 [Silurus asotus]